MVLDYRQLKREFIKKQKQLDKQKTAKTVAAAINLVRTKKAAK